MTIRVHFIKTKRIGFPALGNDRNYVTCMYDTLSEWYFAIIIFTA